MNRRSALDHQVPAASAGELNGSHSRCLPHDRRYRLPLAPVRPHPPPFQDASGNVPSRADEGDHNAGVGSGDKFENGQGKSNQLPIVRFKLKVLLSVRSVTV